MQLENPAPRIELAFRRIQRERMADMPMLNPALQVEAIDFDLYDDGHWLGVLVTPWNLSLMRLPAGEGWQSVPEGVRQMRHFPSGDFAFLGGNEPEIGEYQACSLFTSMAQFPDQETARLTARATRLALLHGTTPAEVPPSPARRGFLTGLVDRNRRNA